MSAQRVPRRQVRENIRSAESVNSLLRIADQIENIPTFALHKNTFEYPPLAFIRILRLIDQCIPITGTQCTDQGIPLAPFQRSQQMIDHVIIVVQARSALHCIETPLHHGQKSLGNNATDRYIIVPNLSESLDIRLTG